MSDAPAPRARARALLLAALTAAPPVWAAATIVRYAVDVPYWDQWELVPLLEAPTIDRLVAPHNEHRIVLPRLVMLALARASGWDVRWELAASFLLALLTFAALVGVARRTLARLEPGGAPLAPALGLLAFSVAAWENWLWGWQLQVFLCVSGVVGAIALLDHDHARGADARRVDALRLGGALLLGVVATASFASGALVWPIGLGLVALRDHPARRRRVGAWAAATAAVVALHALGPPRVAHGAELDLLRLVAYVLSYLGAPLAPGSTVGAAVAGGLGLVSLAAVGAVLVRSGRLRRDELLAPGALAAFAVSCAIGTAAARVGLGVDQARSSRYTTFALLLWCALVMLLEGVGRAPGGGGARLAPALRVGSRVAIVVILGLSVGASFHGRSQAIRHARALVPVRAALLDGTADDALLSRIYPHPALVRERVQRLEAMRLSVFRVRERPR